VKYVTVAEGSLVHVLEETTAACYFTVRVEQAWGGRLGPAGAPIDVKCFG
jgi:hypothetical protein